MLIFLIIQIIVESLPVSSSGHGALFRCILGDDAAPGRTLEEFVHLYSLLLFVMLLFPRWRILVFHPVRTRRLWGNLMMRGFCMELVTLCMYSLGTYYAIDTFVPLSIGFAISGGVFLWLQTMRDGCFAPLTLSAASLIGLVQGLAVIPGISRMGITYAGARVLGMTARHAFWWSCTSALPIFCVGVLRGVHSMTEAQYTFMIQPATQLICAGATVCAGLFLYYTQSMLSAGFVRGFGWYLLGLALVAFVVC